MHRLEAFAWLEIKADKLELNNVIWYNSDKQIIARGIIWLHRKYERMLTYKNNKAVYIFADLLLARNAIAKFRCSSFQRLLR